MASGENLASLRLAGRAKAPYMRKFIELSLRTETVLNPI
jgi:hypothetical protein